MVYGHSSGLPPLEAPDMIAEKRKLFFSLLLIVMLGKPAVNNVSSANLLARQGAPVTLTGVTVQVHMHQMRCIDL